MTPSAVRPLVRAHLVAAPSSAVDHPRKAAPPADRLRPAPSSYWLLERTDQRRVGFAAAGFRYRWKQATASKKPGARLDHRPGPRSPEDKSPATDRGHVPAERSSPPPTGATFQREVPRHRPGPRLRGEKFPATDRGHVPAERSSRPPTGATFPRKEVPDHRPGPRLRGEKFPTAAASVLAGLDLTFCLVVLALPHGSRSVREGPPDRPTRGGNVSPAGWVASALRMLFLIRRCFPCRIQNERAP